MPVHFNKAAGIRSAWRELLSNYNIVATAGNETYHLQQRITKQTKLIFEICRELRMDISEGEIANDGYVSQGVSDLQASRRIIPNALAAIADTMKAQFEWLKGRT